eukprot:TRINITY_DN8726_c0_g1_i2.p1 TRINITY_DN8726_c0_g1~~TRINITY_DN8726_c0_g1_i2.p1  ORF type:complete len:487 (+),score=81.68 TRINITY_DN8726_c0_g1_i2:45-1463(+)
MAAVVFQKRSRQSEPIYPDEGPDIAYYHEVYSGSRQQKLPPMLWLHSWSYLELSDIPAACCPLFAELSEDQDLWRRVSVRRPQERPLRYGESWRSTVLGSGIRQHSQEDPAEVAAEQAAKAARIREHHELVKRASMAKTCWEHFFQYFQFHEISWMAQRFHMRLAEGSDEAIAKDQVMETIEDSEQARRHPSWRSKLGLPLVERLHFSDVSTNALSSQRPFVTDSGAVASILKESERWKFKSLREAYGDRLFRCVSQEPGSNRHRHVWMTLADYLDYSISHDDLEPLYLFDAELPDDLASGVQPPLFLGKDHVAIVAGTEFLCEQRWVAIGGAGSGTRMHVDPVETSAWNLVVEGRKRWVLIPPDKTPPGMQWSSDGGLISPGAALWFRAVAEDEGLQHMLLKRGAVEVEQGPGELIFVPDGWWHIVLNLEPTVAYTENCVTAANLQEVIGALEQLGDRATAVRLAASSEQA